MGIDASSTLFIGAAKASGVDFSRMAMIGRQSFWPSPKALGRVFSRFGIDRDVAAFLRENRYAERFFELLGAQEVVSFDASAYESASVIHDMNLPVPHTWHRRFSCVHDGGTLEHVFNVPQALKNGMEMVAVGGHFTQVNVANNFMGHGFWQFSPELVFRTFSPENGFEIAGVLMHEVVPGGAWYAVRDPDQIRQRVNLCNRRPTYIFTIAKRIAAVEIFKTAPQQSDYQALWVQSANPTPAVDRPPPTWRSHVPQWIKDWAVWRLRPGYRKKYGYAPFQPGFARSGYRRINEDSLLRGAPF